MTMKKIITGILAVVPAVSFAAGANAFSILATLKAFVDRLIPFLIAAGLAYFIFGVIKYVIAKNPEDKGQGSKIIVQGLIGLFVMLSVWGIIGVFQRTFQVGNTTVDTTNIPMVNY